jgi:ferric-dicitrate binding protein FerR (iron transport regulator)
LRQEDQCTRLSVTRGRVVVHAGGHALEALAGQSFLVDQGGLRAAPTLDMDAGAWLDGLIVTRNMRLGDFLAEVARYRPGFLSCAADIAELRLSGVFRLEDTDRLLAVLPQTLPVQLRYRTRWWVTLERAV